MHTASVHVATTDLCDAYEDQLADGRLRVLAPGYLRLGKRDRFAGPAATLKVFEDNSLVRTLLDSPGEGRVLVIDGGGSLRCALVGGNLAQLAEKNGWSGIVVYGCVRDVGEIDACDIGVRALGLHPQKSLKKGAGDQGTTLRFSGVSVSPGEWLYSDADGILIAPAALHA